MNEEKLVKECVEGEEGQSVVEYALIAGACLLGLATFTSDSIPMINVDDRFIESFRTFYLDLSSLLALPFP